MRDCDVRSALHRKVLASHQGDPDTLVVDELAVLRGDARVDVAVVNGALHGYELKSARDNLERLPHQVECYSKVFDRVTIVVAANHLDDASEIVPDWWGVKCAVLGARGAVHFRQRRRPKTNRQVCPLAVASLLWRAEAAAVAEKFALAAAVGRKTRGRLHVLLAQELPTNILRQAVRDALKARGDWRSRPPQVRRGG